MTNELLIGEIRPNPNQPRVHFDPVGLEELRDSIVAHGILQPILVRRVELGYELISGERRWRASQMAGLTRIPAVVRDDVSEAEMLELALVENLQRRDLDPIERAKGYQRLAEEFGLTQEKVAERVGLERSTVANHLRLLQLDERIQQRLASGALSMGHARALLGEADPDVREELAEQAVALGWSVREMERQVRSGLRTGLDSDDGAELRVELQPQPRGSGGLSASGGDDSESTSKEPWARDLERRLKDAFGTQAEVKNRPGFSGQIVLHYFGREDLERLMTQLVPASKV